MKSLRSSEKAKAQVSAEFMIIFVVFIIMVTIVAVAVTQNSNTVLSSTLDMESGKTLSLAKSKLDTVFLEGDGFSTNFTLPQKIMSYDYTISMDSRYLALDVNNQTFWATLLTNNTAGSLRKGENMARNVNGRIVIS